MPQFISIKNATENNLKGIDLDIPKNKIVVITGVSGSGKSTLAFDTIYAEGQRRYLESLSTYSRQFLGVQNKPEVELITGLSPTIAISQKSYSYNPRSNVATITEIYDYIRLLFAKIGIPYSPKTNLPIKKYSIQEITDKILSLQEETKIYIVSPDIGHNSIEEIKKRGFIRIAINGEIFNIYDNHYYSETDKISVIIDRIKIKNNIESRIISSIRSSLELNKNVLEIWIFEKDSEKYQIMKFPTTLINEDIQIPDITPRLFSFNSPIGVCKKCNGLGVTATFDINLIIPDKNKSLLDGAVAPLFDQNSPDLESKTHMPFRNLLVSMAKKYNFNLNTEWKNLPDKIKKIIIHGEQDSLSKGDFCGVMNILEGNDKKYDILLKNNPEQYKKLNTCTQCNGYRLNNEALSIKVGNYNIGEISSMYIDDAINFFINLPSKLNTTELQISTPIIKEINKRLLAIKKIGLDYLNLNREAITLSGGEAQRIRLVSQIGTGLSGILYVLDEPSIGLHHNESKALIEMIKELRDLENTVIIVEHEEEIIKNADYIIEIGPGSGVNGGKIVAKGTIDEIKNNKESLTGLYISKAKYISVPKQRRSYTRSINLYGVSRHNIKKLNVKIPLGVFVCITGASGSGKSTLISDILYNSIKDTRNMSPTNTYFEKIEGTEYIKSVIKISYTNINKTPRSNPATYINIFDEIRTIFASQPESKALGFDVSKFSFNNKSGRCHMCEGNGLIKIDMHFLSDMYVVCESCEGKRYNKETLMVKYKNKTIADVMDLTIDEALLFFANFSKIYEKMLLLQQVGLGYLKLGQPANTLSGGEMQRIKLAKELSKTTSNEMIYIMDEPTVGLHTDDLHNLIAIINKIVEKKNTVIVIEHNVNVIKNADYVIEMGDGGGKYGGKIITQGTPEEIAKNNNSYIGKYLNI